jgi:hypothetical protein
MNNLLRPLLKLHLVKELNYAATMEDFVYSLQTKFLTLIIDRRESKIFLKSRCDGWEVNKWKTLFTSSELNTQHLL